MADDKVTRTAPSTTSPRTELLPRAAAVVALLALAGAITLVGVAGADNFGSLLLVLAGVLLSVLGAWHALTRRGTVGAAGWVAVAAGVGLLVGGIVAGDLRAGRIAGFALLGLISVAAARVALGKDARSVRLRTQVVEPAPPARHPVLIMNTRSGGGKAEKFRLVEECEQRGIEAVVLQPGDDLVQLAEEAIARGADVIGMAGGDGSQALVAKIASDHDVAHVVVPAGTRNHFALDLGLDRDDVVGALDAFSDGIERRVDLASVNGRIFVNNATLGLYARIVQSPEYRDAKRQTTLSMLPELLGPDAERLDLRFSSPTGDRRTTADVILVSNDPYELQRFGGLGTRERLDLGVLGIATVTLSGATDAAQFVGLELAGQVQRFPGWTEWTDRRFVVESAEPIEIGVDGEALTMEPPLVFESIPMALRVRLPRGKAGTSPAGRASHVLSASTLTTLILIIAGKAGPRDSPGMI
jgi:diacylglycerol kinase family enzyme